MMARIEREEENWEQGFHLVRNWGGRLGSLNEEQVRIEHTERITEALKATTFVSTRNFDENCQDAIMFVQWVF
jgi:hypothetical protein